MEPGDLDLVGTDLSSAREHLKEAEWHVLKGSPDRATMHAVIACGYLLAHSVQLEPDEDQS